MAYVVFRTFTGKVDLSNDPPAQLRVFGRNSRIDDGDPYFSFFDWLG